MYVSVTSAPSASGSSVGSSVQSSRAISLSASVFLSCAAAAEAFQLRYKVVVVEDCTIVHGQARAEAGGKEAALSIIKSVLQSEVIPLDQVEARYLQPQ